MDPLLQYRPKVVRKIPGRCRQLANKYDGPRATAATCCRLLQTVPGSAVCRLGFHPQAPKWLMRSTKRASALDDAQSRFQRPARAGERAAPAVEFSFASSRSAAMTSSSPFLAFMASSRRCRASPVAVARVRGFLAWC